MGKEEKLLLFFTIFSIYVYFRSQTAYSFCEIWLLGLFFPQFCKSYVSSCGYLEVFQSPLGFEITRVDCYLLPNLFCPGRATPTEQSLLMPTRERQNKLRTTHYFDSMFSNNLLPDLFCPGRVTVTVNILYHWHQEKVKTNYDAMFRLYVFE